MTITLPFDDAQVPAGRTAALYKTDAQGQWRAIAATFDGDSVSASVTGFSSAQVVIPALDSTPIGRDWRFAEYRGGKLQDLQIVERMVETGGSLQVEHDFGQAFFDAPFVLLDGTTIPRNGRAEGVIVSSEDGLTIYLAAEAPRGHEFVPDEPFSGEALLTQVQTFAKIHRTAVRVRWTEFAKTWGRHCAAARLSIHRSASA